MVILAVIVLGLMFIPSTTHGDKSLGLLWINPLESLPENPNPALIKSALSYISVQYGGINPDEIFWTLHCESRFKHNAIGDNGLAFGIAQFHKKTFETYCSGKYESAKDQINCMAGMFILGESGQWTCYRNLYGK